MEKIEPGINYNRFYSQDGQLRSWEFDSETDFIFRNGFEIELQIIDDYQVFEKGFRNNRIQLETGWDSRDGRTVFVFAGTGVNFDSDLRLYGAEIEWAFGDRLRLEYSATRLELDPDPELETTWIHVFNGVYYFNPDLFIKLFLQTNTAVDKLNIQAVWVWRFKPPFGSIQVAYQRGTSDIGEASEPGRHPLHQAVLGVLNHVRARSREAQWNRKDARLAKAPPSVAVSTRARSDSGRRVVPTGVMSQRDAFAAASRPLRLCSRILHRGRVAGSWSPIKWISPARSPLLRSS